MQMMLRGGSMMRYGSCQVKAPALLAEGVVAGSQGPPLITLARLADAPPALHLGTVGRAVALPAVAVAANDHQPLAPCAVEHPVALRDEAAPATGDWTQGPPPTIISSTVE